LENWERELNIIVVLHFSYTYNILQPVALVLVMLCYAQCPHGV